MTLSSIGTFGQCTSAVTLSLGTPRGDFYSMILKLYIYINMSVPTLLYIYIRLYDKKIKPYKYLSFFYLFLERLLLRQKRCDSGTSVCVRGLSV